MTDYGDCVVCGKPMPHPGHDGTTIHSYHEVGCPYRYPGEELGDLCECPPAECHEECCPTCHPICSEGHDGPVVVMNTEPIDDGIGLMLKCEECGTHGTAAISLDEIDWQRRRT